MQHPTVQIALLLFLLLLLMAPFAALAGLMTIGAGLLIYRLVLLVIAVALGEGQGEEHPTRSVGSTSQERS